MCLKSTSVCSFGGLTERPERVKKNHQSCYCNNTLVIFLPNICIECDCFTQKNQWTKSSKYNSNTTAVALLQYQLPDQQLLTTSVPSNFFPEFFPFQVHLSEYCDWKTPVFLWQMTSNKNITHLYVYVRITVSTQHLKLGQIRKNVLKNTIKMQY